MDPRASQLATIFIDHSLKLQSGDKFLLCASDFTALELIQECYRLAIQRGALVELDIGGMRKGDFGGFMRTLIEHGTDAQLSTLPEVSMFKAEWADALLFITTIHDDLYLSGIDSSRLSLWNKATFPILEKTMGKRWLLTQWPTEAISERSNMNLEQFTDFYYDACLVDYAAESKRLQGLSDILDAGKFVRIQAEGTDLTLGIEGRLAAGTNVGRRNVPDGECFLAPLEDKTSGVITFELPQRRSGNVFEGIRLEFQAGKIVNATATKNQELFLAILDEHPDNRRLGELGIGMNQKITKYIQNILFDEKIAGTIHMALGKAYQEERGGGKNQGSIHWDLVKDLRHPGTLVTVDERVIIKDGEILARVKPIDRF